jgi:hypothetical protein
MIIKTVRFSNFWDGFLPEEFIITRILRETLNQRFEIVQNSKTEVDLEIDSVFQFPTASVKAIHYLRSRYFNNSKDYFIRNAFGYRSRETIKAKKTFWYTAENLRPPVGVYDVTFSFNPNCSMVNNVYLPYWMTLMNWRIENMGMPEFNSNEFQKSKAKVQRKRVACSFSSILEPERTRILESVSKVMPIELFGKAHGNYIQDKVATSKQFGYQICNENDAYPGYVTEKLFEAWSANNIPIWSGLTVDDIINEEAFLNVTGLNSEQISNLLDISGSSEQKIRSSPILKSPPSLDFLVETIANSLEL